MPFAHMPIPFAQAGGAGAGRDEVLIGVMMAVGGISIIAGLAIQILFLMTLHRALRECAPRNRLMEPGQVFLNLIPCFGAVWLFFTVSRVSQSMRHEFDDRGVDVDGDFGQQLGISYAALSLAWIIPYVGFLFAIAGVVCWIVYWVKIADYGRQLREGDSYREERDEYRRRRRDERERDEYDDRRSRRRDRYDDRDNEMSR